MSARNLCRDRLHIVAAAAMIIAGAAHAERGSVPPPAPIEYWDVAPPPADGPDDRLFPPVPTDFLASLFLQEGLAMSPGASSRYIPYPTPGPPGPPAPDGAWAMIPPPSHYGTAAVFDPVRDRVLVIGGAPPYEDGIIDVWAFSAAGGGSWEPVAVTGVAPPGRTFHSAVYDPVRDRVIVFGGNTEYAAYWTSLNDVWALDLSPSPTWSQIVPFGTPPSRRVAAAAVYDPSRNRMLLFGGRDAGTTNQGDLWQLTLGDNPEWSRLLPVGQGPGARNGAGLVYDPARDRLVLAGGFTNSGSGSSDVWALPLGSGVLTWTLLRGGGGPTGHYDQQMIHDPGTDRLIAFVGYVFPYEFGGRAQLWTFSLSSLSWTREVSEAMPAQRFAEAMAHDTHRQRLVVCWGWDSNATPYGGEAYTDAWAYDLQNQDWEDVSPAGPAPSQRLAHTATYDPVRRRMVVVGGMATGLWRHSAVPAGDTWALGLSAPHRWERLASPTSLPGRAFHTTIYDSSRDRMVVFGGMAYLPNSYTAVFLADVWTMSLSGPPEWTPLTIPGPGPGPRAYHSAIYDPQRDRMLVYGGRDENYLARFDQVWSLSFSGNPGWTLMTPGGDRPPGRAGHAALYDPIRKGMVVFGGQTANSGSFGTNEVFVLELNGNPQWSSIATAGPQGLPVGRAYHGCVYDALRRRMIMMGGIGDTYNYTRLNDVWQLSLQGPAEWIPLDTGPAGPRYRSSFGLVYDSAGDVVVQSAGNLNIPLFFDTWLLDLSPAPPAPQAPVASSSNAEVDERPLTLRVHTTHRSIVASGGAGREGLAVLEVHDVAGRRFLSREVRPGRDGAFSTEIAITGAPGIYFITVRQGARRAVARTAIVH